MEALMLRGTFIAGLLTMSFALVAAPAAEAGFGCAASAGPISVPGLRAIVPFTAGGSGDCAGETSSLEGKDIGLPDPLSASAVVAGTEVYSAQKAVLASGGI